MDLPVLTCLLPSHINWVTCASIRTTLASVPNAIFCYIKWRNSCQRITWVNSYGRKRGRRYGLVTTVTVASHCQWQSWSNCNHWSISRQLAWQGYWLASQYISWTDTTNLKVLVCLTPHYTGWGTCACASATDWSSWSSRLVIIEGTYCRRWVGLVNYNGA